MIFDGISLVLAVIAILGGILSILVSLQINNLFNPGITRKLSLLFVMFISLIVMAQLIELGRNLFDLPMVLDYFKYFFIMVGFAIFLLAGYEVLQFANVFGFKKSAF